MKISDNGLKFIEGFELFVDHWYICPAGVKTIGIGHAFRPGDEVLPDPMTHDFALELLDRDCDIAEDAVTRLIKVPLSQSQFDMLVSFTFNCGTGALQSSTMRSRLNRGEYEGAAEAMQWWVWGGKPPRKLPGLIRRRAVEADIFISNMP